MNLENYLKENDFIANKFGNYIYSRDNHHFNLLVLINDVKELVINDVNIFIKANPKLTAEQILKHLEELNY